MQSAIQARRPDREAVRLVANLAAIGLTTNLQAPNMSSLISDCLTAANGGVGFVAARALRSYANELDRTRAHAANMAATRAALETRRDQHRRIHDSAQQIFEAVARGDELNRDDLLGLIEREIVRLDEAAFTRPLHTGLADMVQRLADEFEHRGLTVTATPVDEPRLGPDALNALADCVREALQNVWQHAGSNVAVVHAERLADLLLVTVADTGCGFDRVNTPLGFGLGELLNTRLLPLGGVVRVDSIPDVGTTVTMQIPLSARAVSPAERENAGSGRGRRGR
jgi:signal transduction histidine kinase